MKRSDSIYCNMCCDQITYVREIDMPDVEEFHDCLEHMDRGDMIDEILDYRKKTEALEAKCRDLEYRLHKANETFREMAEIAGRPNNG